MWLFSGCVLLFSFSNFMSLISHSPERSSFSFYSDLSCSFWFLKILIFPTYLTYCLHQNRQCSKGMCHLIGWETSNILASLLTWKFLILLMCFNSRRYVPKGESKMLRPKCCKYMNINVLARQDLLNSSSKKKKKKWGHEI